MNAYQFSVYQFNSLACVSCADAGVRHCQFTPPPIQWLVALIYKSERKQEGSISGHSITQTGSPTVVMWSIPIMNFLSLPGLKKIMRFSPHVTKMLSHGIPSIIKAGLVRSK